MGGAAAASRTAPRERHAALLRELRLIRRSRDGSSASRSERCEAGCPKQRSSLPRRCSRAPRSSTTFALGRECALRDPARARGVRGRRRVRSTRWVRRAWRIRCAARSAPLLPHAALPGNAGFTRATRGTGEDPRARAVAQHGIGWAARSSSNERADHTGNRRRRATRDGGRRAMTANADRRTTAAPPTRSVHRTSLRLRWRNASGIVYALRL